MKELETHAFDTNEFDRRKFEKEKNFEGIKDIRSITSTLNKEVLDIRLSKMKNLVEQGIEACKEINKLIDDRKIEGYKEDTFRGVQKQYKLLLSEAGTAYDYAWGRIQEQLYDPYFWEGHKSFEKSIQDIKAFHAGLEKHLEKAEWVEYTDPTNSRLTDDQRRKQVAQVRDRDSQFTIEQRVASLVSLGDDSMPECADTIKQAAKYLSPRVMDDYESRYQLLHSKYNEAFKNTMDARSKINPQGGPSQFAMLINFGMDLSTCLECIDHFEELTKSISRAIENDKKIITDIHQENMTQEDQLKIQKYIEIAENIIMSINIGIRDISNLDPDLKKLSKEIKNIDGKLKVIPQKKKIATEKIAFKDLMQLYSEEANLNRLLGQKRANFNNIKETKEKDIQSTKEEIIKEFEAAWSTYRNSTKIDELESAISELVSAEETFLVKRYGDGDGDAFYDYAHSRSEEIYKAAKYAWSKFNLSTGIQKQEIKQIIDANHIFEPIGMNFRTDSLSVLNELYKSLDGKQDVEEWVKINDRCILYSEVAKLIAERLGEDPESYQQG